MSATHLGVLPALPLHEAGKYVAGAYVVVFALVLIYVAIMAIRANRVERELAELLAQDQHGPAHPIGDRPAAGDRETQPQRSGGERDELSNPRAESTPV
jgi:hypothetical protein